MSTDLIGLCSRFQPEPLTALLLARLTPNRRRNDFGAGLANPSLLDGFLENFPRPASHSATRPADAANQRIPLREHHQQLLARRCWGSENTRINHEKHLPVGKSQYGQHERSLPRLRSRSTSHTSGADSLCRRRPRA